MLYRVCLHALEIMRTICRGEKLSIDRSARNELDAETYEQLTLSVRKKKTRGER